MSAPAGLPAAAVSLAALTLRHHAGRRSRRSTVVTKPTRVALPAAPGKGSASGLRPPLPVSAVLAPGALLALAYLSTRAAFPAASRSGPLTTPARSPPGSAKGCALPGWFGGRLPSTAGPPCRGLCVRSRWPFLGVRFRSPPSRPPAGGSAEWLLGGCPPCILCCLLYGAPARAPQVGCAHPCSGTAIISPHWSREQKRYFV